MALLLLRASVGVSLLTWLSEAAWCGPLGGGQSAAQGCRAPGEGDTVELLQHNLRLQRHGVKSDASETVVADSLDSKLIPDDVLSEETADVSGIPDSAVHEIIDPATALAYHGPLALLPGTWMGQQGKQWSCLLLAYPSRGVPQNFTTLDTKNFGGDTKDVLGYKEVGVEVEPPGRFLPDLSVTHSDYVDSITFKEIAGSMLERGLNEDLHVLRVSYEQAASLMMASEEFGEVQPMEGQPGEGLHVETGILAWVENASDVERQSLMGHGQLPYLAGRFDVFNGSDAKEELLRQVRGFDYGLKVEPQGCFPSSFDLPGDVGGVQAELVRDTEAMRQVDFFVRIDMEDFAPLGENPWFLKELPVTSYHATWWIVAATAEDGSREWMLQYAQVQRLAIMQRLECMTCPGAERGPDGCYDKAEILGNAQCFFDVNATVPPGQPSCREQERATFPHVQSSTLKKIA